MRLLLIIVERQAIFYFYFSLFFHVTLSRGISTLPSCLWTLRMFVSLSGAHFTVFDREASQHFSYTSILLTCVLKLSVAEERTLILLDKNRTHDFWTTKKQVCRLPTRHSGDEGYFQFSAFFVDTSNEYPYSRKCRFFRYSTKHEPPTWSTITIYKYHKY